MQTMQERGYRHYACPECGAAMWIHRDDGDDTDVQCLNCTTITTAGDRACANGKLSLTRVAA